MSVDERDSLATPLLTRAERRALREQRGLSRAAVAAGTGFSHSVVWRSENHSEALTYVDLLKIDTFIRDAEVRTGRAPRAGRRPTQPAACAHEALLDYIQTELTAAVEEGRARKQGVKRLVALTEHVRSSR